MNTADDSYGIWKAFFETEYVDTIQAIYESDNRSAGQGNTVRLMEMRGISVKGRNQAAMETLTIRKKTAMDNYAYAVNELEGLKRSDMPLAQKVVRRNVLEMYVVDAQNFIQQYNHVMSLIRSQ